MNSTPENDIELLAFLTAPGEIKITIGGQTFTQNAPAGMTSFKVPTQPGVPKFALSRGGADVFRSKAACRSTDRAGCRLGPWI